MPTVIRRQEPQEVVQAFQPVPVRPFQSGVGQVAEGLSAVGEAFEIVQERVDTARAKEADNQFSAAVRQHLYQDGSGFLNSLGANALGGSQSTVESLQSARESILQGLPQSAREKAQASIDKRFEQAQTRIANHHAKQSRVYSTTQRAARVDSAVSDATLDPALVQQSIGIVRSELEEQGEADGWAPEVLERKVLEAESRIHSNVIKRIAAVDPIGAMAYLQDNKENMDGAEVARLSNALSKDAKEFQGRELGKQFFRQDKVQGPIDASQVKFVDDTAGKIRNLPVQQGVLNKIALAAAATDPRISIKIVSGGQPSADQGGRRTGSTRHDNGGAADIVLQIDGKDVLPGDDPALYEAFFENAAAAGINGMGHYSWGIHLGGGSVAFWGPTTRSASADPRFKAAVDRGRGKSLNGPVPQQVRLAQRRAILGIQDPVIQAAAERQFDKESALENAENALAQQQAQDQVFQFIEGGGSVDDLPTDLRQGLGQEALSSLRTYESKRDTGQRIETDIQTFHQLQTTFADNPARAAQINLLEFRDKLSDGDLKSLIEKQAGIKGGANVQSASASQIRSVSSTIVQAFGLDSDSRSAAQQRVLLESELFKFADEFAATNKTAPTEADLHRRAQELLTPVIVNGTGSFDFFDEQTGPFMNIDFEGDRVDPDDDITLAKLASDTFDLKINGTKVPRDQIARFITAFEQDVGRVPLAREIVDVLIRSGQF